MYQISDIVEVNEARKELFTQKSRLGSRGGVTWVPIFLYSSMLTSLRKENHLETLQMRENWLEKNQEA